MEASALSHASRRGLLARRSPLLRLEGDERLVALIRSGHDRAFEVLFDRYHSRLLAFCASILKSRQDAEDILQEVFVNAHRAMLADDRRINVRPWLYRIARNRCLNHLRRPVPEGQDSMDVLPHMHGTTTAEHVQKREELRGVIRDVHTLPDTQKIALLLREVDQLSYDEIAVAMETTIPAVKSLLVRARITLAESSEARALSCEEVRVTLAEAAEGVSRASGPVRIHLRECESCSSFRDQLRSDSKALASVFPFGPLAALKTGLLSKLFGGGGGAGSSGAIVTAGGSACAGGTAGALGGMLGSKAAAGVATAALLTAGAVEVRQATNRAEPLRAAPLEQTPPATVSQAPRPAAKSRPAPRKTRVAAAASAPAPASAERAGQRASEEEASAAASASSSSTATAEASSARAEKAPAEESKGTGSAAITDGGVASGPTAGGSSSRGEGEESSPPPAEGDGRPVEGGVPPVDVTPEPPALPAPAGTPSAD